MRDFTTDRLRVQNLTSLLADDDKQYEFEVALVEVLTAPVLAHLSPSLQFNPATDRVATWIAARMSESEVYGVLGTHQGQVLGLLILAKDAGSVHLGYLFAQAAWGKGYATELLTGLVTAFDDRAQVTLRGGVDRNNPASARVLEKAGFTPNPSASTKETLVFERIVGSVVT